MIENSLDVQFISSALRTGKWDECVRANQIGSKHINGKLQKELWEFISNHISEYGRQPGITIVESKFDIKLPEVETTPEFLAAELRQRLDFERIKELGAAVDQKIRINDIAGAKKAIADFGEADISEYSEGKNVPASQLVDAFIKQYQDRKSKIFGILSPWNTMNEWTLGFWKKDLSFFVGRSGLGKSFMLAMLGIHARRMGHEALLISCEMKADDFAGRIFSIEHKMPYGLVRRGSLPVSREIDFFMELKNKSSYYEGLEIRDASGGMSIDDVEHAIRTSRATFILIDSVYRIRPRHRARDRFEAMGMVVDDLKAFALKYDRSIIAATQLNRESMKKDRNESEGLSQSDIALSDVINWNSTNIFGLIQSKQDADASRMQIYPIKIRESGNAHRSMLVHWDFAMMRFDEITGDDEDDEEDLEDRL